MRFYLLPISTRRTLLYCQKLHAPASEKPTWSDWLQAKTSRTWSGWEKKDKGWQKSVVSYGNQVLRRIPYEEWGLKSVPPLSQRRKQVELKGTEKVEIVYPKSLLAMDRVPQVLKALATEREALHKRRMIWCFIGMPITAPIALLPVIPNLPFFYLVYRAWSHWRALCGGKHIQFLINNNLLALTPSPVVDAVYAEQKEVLPSTPKPTTDSSEVLVNNPHIFASQDGAQNPDGETMLMSQANGKKMTQALDLPQLEVELERAIWQVEAAIKKRNATAAAKNPEETTSEDEKKSQ
ncbi:mitochondrial K+-H+ exchange-related-domain-containing protein [Chaetomidium leptoderma]|uniref:Mitochondrial K+-H+ exchange-related-domain-containing protein n=1 Tax=Chaetomidium leptoderma TaxID=669021 RepID=A0AAN7A1U4_9PEZI|nr:mitochondrial K+-H+ exchange-related-domain-containing protein [Chaetomidium leptoderma]